MTSSYSKKLQKDFLSVLDLAPENLVRLIDLAIQLKSERSFGNRAPTAEVLSGAHVALLFEKPSLRTRATFEVAVRELGGEVLHIPKDTIDGTREPLEDVARNLERWVKALVIRTFAQQKTVALSSATTTLHVVNALTDEQHPCQALADMMTLKEHWGNWQNRTIAYVGDGNNVAVSLIQAALMLGVSVTLASPNGHEVPNDVLERASKIARDGATVRHFPEPRQAVVDADAVYTDVWTSMGHESETSKRKEVFSAYQVNEKLMSIANPKALFLHCLPAHRGEEVTREVIESQASVVFDQAENRLHTQKALLLMLLS
jgi:ornithine carbamoyltransferase